MQVTRNGYFIGWVEDAAFDEHAFAAAEIDRCLIKTLEPWVFVSIGEKQKQALDLDAGAIL